MSSMLKRSHLQAEESFKILEPWRCKVTLLHHNAKQCSRLDSLLVLGMCMMSIKADAEDEINYCIIKNVNVLFDSKCKCVLHHNHRPNDKEAWDWTWRRRKQCNQDHAQIILGLTRAASQTDPSLLCSTYMMCNKISSHECNVSTAKRDFMSSQFLLDGMVMHLNRGG